MQQFVTHVDIEKTQENAFALSEALKQPRTSPPKVPNNRSESVQIFGFRFASVRGHGGPDVDLKNVDLSSATGSRDLGPASVPTGPRWHFVQLLNSDTPEVWLRS